MKRRKAAPKHGERRLSSDPTIARAQLGDYVALGRLTQEYRDRCTNFLFKILQDAELAEEVYQDVCVKLVGHIASYDATYQFTTWLYTVAKNMAFNHLRRRKRYEFVDIETIAGELPSPDGRPDVHLHRGDISRAVAEAVASLPEKMHEAFTLVRLRGYSYEEAAAKLDLPIGTVKSRVTRAHQEIRTFFRLYYAELIPPRARAKKLARF